MTTQTESIKVKANQSLRTFTIRKYINEKLFVKYRTIELNQDEFDREEMNTEKRLETIFKVR